MALGTLKIAAQEARLPAYPLEAVDGRAHLEALAKRYGLYTSLARAGIGQANSLNDADTADLFTEISGTVDKQLRFLEAQLQARCPTYSQSASAVCFELKCPGNIVQHAEL